MNVNQLRGKLTVGTSSSVPLITITSRGGSTTQAIEMNAAVGDALVEKVEADQVAALDDDLEIIDGEIERQTRRRRSIRRAPSGRSRRTCSARCSSSGTTSRPRTRTGSRCSARPFARANRDQPEAGAGRRPRLRAGADRQLRAGRRAHRARVTGSRASATSPACWPSGASRSWGASRAHARAPTCWTRSGSCAPT